MGGGGDSKSVIFYEKKKNVSLTAHGDWKTEKRFHNPKVDTKAGFIRSVPNNTQMRDQQRLEPRPHTCGLH